MRATAVSSSFSAKLSVFQSFTVAHPYLVEAKEQLLAAIRDSASNSLVLVLGPTGVGKTTLLKRIEQILTEELLPDLNADRGRIPVVSVEAIAPESGNFGWRDHFKRLLVQLEEPLIKYKRSPLNSQAGNIEPCQTPHPKTPASEYRYAVEQALRYRRPRAVLIDEAQHLARMASGRKLLDQLDVIKSIASQTGTVHVLCGTYELLAFRNLSGQLSRRSIDIHFQRYRAEEARHRKTFLGVLRSFHQHLPLQAPDLVTEWEYLYEGSLGCVGILKDWLSRTLLAVSRGGKDMMSHGDLEAHALSVSQREKMLSEILEGETQLQEARQGRDRLRVRLGLGGVVDRASEATESVKHRKTLPGHRLPVRDAIGVMRPPDAASRI